MSWNCNDNLSQQAGEVGRLLISSRPEMRLNIRLSWTLEGPTQFITVWGVSPVTSMQILEHERSQGWDCCWDEFHFTAVGSSWVGGGGGGTSQDEINNYSTVLLSTRDDRPGGTKGVHQSTPTIYSGIQSPEERNQVGNMGNCLLGFCLVNNNKQSGWNGGNF